MPGPDSISGNCTLFFAFDMGPTASERSYIAVSVVCEGFSGSGRESPVVPTLLTPTLQADVSGVEADPY